MNIDRMINMLLLNLSKKYNVFYMEKRTYKEMQTYKNYSVKIDELKKEFKSKRDLLTYLSKLK